MSLASTSISVGVRGKIEVRYVLKLAVSCDMSWGLLIQKYF